jgi:succinoglycan biosynthesis transport protein ExoP
MVLPGMSQPSYMGTQVDLIRSERVVIGALKTLQLEQSDALREAWARATNSAPGTFMPWLTKLVQGNIIINPAKDSNVISVSFKANSPEFAYRMTNALIESYINTTLELRVEPAKRFRSLFDDQLKQAGQRLEVAQNKLSEYQRQHGMVATDERLDIENTRLTELSNQLVAMQGLRAEASSRQQQSAAQPDRTPEVLINPVVSSLNADLARLEAKLKEQLATLGEAHPTVQETRANINELRSRITAETSKVTASVGINSKVSKEREAMVRADLEQQRTRVLSLKAERDQANVMQREVQSAQDAFERIHARRDVTGLESEANQTNVSVVQRANMPFAPSSPNLMVNLVLAFALGLVFSLGVALLLELWDRRLLSDDDIVVSLGLPIMGSLSIVPLQSKSGQLPGAGFKALNKQQPPKALSAPRKA